MPRSLRDGRSGHRGSPDRAIVVSISETHLGGGDARGDGGVDNSGHFVDGPGVRRVAVGCEDDAPSSQAPFFTTTQK